MQTTIENFKKVSSKPAQTHQNVLDEYTSMTTFDLRSLSWAGLIWIYGIIRILSHQPAHTGCVRFN